MPLTRYPLAASLSLLLLLLVVPTAVGAAPPACATAPPAAHVRQGMPPAVSGFAAPSRARDTALQLDRMILETVAENPGSDPGTALTIVPASDRLTPTSAEERGAPASAVFPPPPRYHLYCVLRM